jgi:hypothetical protein
LSDEVKTERLAEARIFGVRGEPDRAVLRLRLVDGTEINLDMHLDDLAGLGQRMVTDAKFLKMPMIEGTTVQ